MYKRVQFPRMQSSSVWIVHWKRELLHVHFHKEGPSASSRTRLGSLGPRAASPSPSLPRSIGIFPVSATPPEVRLLRPLLLVVASTGNSMFLYSLLKSAANAVLKLMSAVIAIAHVLFVSMKSLSVSIMLLEYSFGKLKYDSTTLPMSGFLGSSPVSASKSLLFLLLFLIFFYYQVFVKIGHVPGTIYSQHRH